MGSTHAGQRVNGRRRLAASDDKDGGAARKCFTGHHSTRELHLRVPGSEAHPLVVVVGPAVVRIDGGDQIGGGRSSDRCGLALGGTTGQMGGRARLLGEC